jgi:hypothetical protein
MRIASVLRTTISPLPSAVEHEHQHLFAGLEMSLKGLGYQQIVKGSISVGSLLKRPSLVIILSSNLDVM